MFTVLKMLYLLMSIGDNGATWEDQFVEPDEDKTHFVRLDGDVQLSKNHSRKAKVLDCPQ